ncbi:cobalt-precorrin-5B (C(1))-methyltransferase [Cylindrospermopsis raciborskii CENA303]|uniref:Cobalt-precorrin-5B C(1)-methyltransferase n=1 Tax=Cylindrospermopsis raciborskii CENA303 TaxID=1170769 RepID=A0A1X4G3J0_9CYAN|nr:cobalt-precorrin-5B (C(1))-methyltransferase CbiD [Cylindrospermopsis raciborskii]EFA74044.1 Putative cobalt-precorrin-6A synthase [Raphidiopsis brookii D9]OSO88055.1 cobalt-precorrin-5B (C(1))-methyltransferase [Cylindrospermopsis raciborskii CENA303]
MSRSGYTLPVFACGGAIAALYWLRHCRILTTADVDLISPDQIVEIPIEQVAGISESGALAITRSDPGDNLDLTKGTPIWTKVEWYDGEGETIVIRGGEGIGKDLQGIAAIYTYAQQLLRKNLEKLLFPGEKILVTVILPEGRSLATRTSNPAFGVVEGLSLLGTSGISQPLSTPEQLEVFRDDLRTKAKEFNSLVFCIGENGLDLGRKLGINPQRMVKTANWIGPLLVEAHLLEVEEILLFGYHGKLMKLAGGIFHTHHHLADGRREIIVAHSAILGLKYEDIQIIFHSPRAEDALQHLRFLDTISGSNWTNQIYFSIAQTIDNRSQEYIKSHSDQSVKTTVCGSVLFDRNREVIVKSQTGCVLMEKLC